MRHQNKELEAKNTRRKKNCKKERSKILISIQKTCLCSFFTVLDLAFCLKLSPQQKFDYRNHLYKYSWK